MSSYSARQKRVLLVSILASFVPFLDALLTGAALGEVVVPVATADHSEDEHRIDPPRVVAGNVVAGTGFTIYGVNSSQLNEPVEVAPPSSVMHENGTAVIVKNAQPAAKAYGGGAGTRLYGKWNLGWVWN